MKSKKRKNVLPTEEELKQTKLDYTLNELINNPELAGETKVEIKFDKKNDFSMELINLDWDDLYKEDMKNPDLAFEIDDPNGINKQNVRSLRGIYSPLYGTELSDDSDYLDKYSCECKKYKGVFYYDADKPFICKKCLKPVVKRDSDMRKTGWISLREDLHLINPLYYFMMEKVIGKKQLNNIIYYSKDRDEDGNVIINLDYFDENNPFYAIGLVEFYNRFDEILDYYKDNIKGTPQLREEKLEMYEFLKQNKDKIFCNHFPVYTLLLRPILMIKNNLIYANINTKYQTLVTNVADLNKNNSTIDSKDLKILPLMYQCQLLLNQIHKMTIEEQISGKEGHIRLNMLGELFKLFRPSKNILIAG